MRFFQPPAPDPLLQHCKTYAGPNFLVRDPSAGYCMVEGLVGAGVGPPLHRHPSDDEALYVLGGTFRFVIGLETRIGRAGDFVSIPRGEVHTFRNIGQAPARTLIINTPGTAHIGFFSQAGEPMPSGMKDLPPLMGPPDVSRLLGIGQRNGIEFLLLQHRKRLACPAVARDPGTPAVASPVPSQPHSILAIMRNCAAGFYGRGASLLEIAALWRTVGVDQP